MSRYLLHFGVDHNMLNLYFKYSTWYNTLYEALLREGVEVRFDSPVENLEPNDGFTRVHLQSGEVFEADVVVAADGIGSAIRGEVNDSSTDLGETEKLLILNASVSRDDMDAYGLWPAPRTKELVCQFTRRMVWLLIDIYRIPLTCTLVRSFSALEVHQYVVWMSRSHFSHIFSGRQIHVIRRVAVYWTCSSERIL